MKKIMIKENDANQRIDKYLKKLLCNASSNFIYKMFRKKDIKINGTRVNEKYILQKGDVLEMFLYEDKFNELTKEKDIYQLKREFKVLYEDKNILIVDKPVGLLVHGDANENVNTLSHQVLSYLKEKGELDISRESTFIPGPVHRLDRNTSGIVIFGKTLVALQDLNEMMKKRHHIEKSYMTICKGKLIKKQELVGYVKKIENEDRVRFVKKDDKDALMMKTIVKPIRTTNDFSLVETSPSPTLGINSVHGSSLYASNANVANGSRLIPYISSTISKFAYLADILTAFAIQTFCPDAAPIHKIS